MGRESRGVLLLVALAVLAAADAFSTDSKSALFCQNVKHFCVGATASERGARVGVGSEGELVLQALARIHPAASSAESVSRSFLMGLLSLPGLYRDISMKFSVIINFIFAPLLSPF